jgi:hypothetical protein
MIARGQGAIAVRRIVSRKRFMRREIARRRAILPRPGGPPCPGLREGVLEGGSGSEGRRSTLAERGAIVMWSSVPGDRFVAAGIVADPVAAVRVGEIPAALRVNDSAGGGAAWRIRCSL